MAKKSTEDLETFLKRQNSDVLVNVLLELAGQFEGVNDRLERLQLADRPDKLAADFRKTLAVWRRSKKFYSYRESCAFGLELERWLMQVGSELGPKDPAAALALFESFIESDASWFERADDSDGCIGDAMRCACEQWLEAARRCESPPDEWPPRIVALYRADEYGGREALLRHADLLLGVDGLRLLVAEFESEMAQALSTAVGLHTRAGLPSGVYRLSGALNLLSEALHDPDVLVRSVCSYSPQPNGLQKESFVVAYLKEDRAEDAMRWLEDSWGPQFEGRLMGRTWRNRRLPLNVATVDCSNGSNCPHPIDFDVCLPLMGHRAALHLHSRKVMTSFLKGTQPQHANTGNEQRDEEDKPER